MSSLWVPRTHFSRFYGMMSMLNAQLRRLPISDFAALTGREASNFSTKSAKDMDVGGLALFMEDDSEDEAFCHSFRFNQILFFSSSYSIPLNDDRWRDLDGERLASRVWIPEQCFGELFAGILLLGSDPDSFMKRETVKPSPRSEVKQPASHPDVPGFVLEHDFISCMNSRWVIEAFSDVLIPLE